MLITSGAGGLALQVSVRQRTIDFGSGRASLRPPAITKRFSLRRNAARARHNTAEDWNSIIL